MKEVKDMTLEEVEARLAELDGLMSPESEAKVTDEMTEEMRSLQEHKAELVALETRKAQAEEIRTGKTDETVEVIEERKEVNTMKKIEEYRNSKEYIDAFAEYVKTGKDEEVRALLTTNVGDAGEVAIPDFVSDIIKTDWLESGILSRVAKISVGGNYKQQFELTAGDAVIHDEGSGAVSEEELTLGTVTLIPQSIKKWIGVSDEINDMKGEAFLNYVYKELAHKIRVKAESILIGKIAALNTSASETAVCAKKVKAGAALGTIATALGELNAEATNPIIVMNPSTKAAFKAAVYAGQFNADPFEGLQVVLTNALPAVGTATENQVYAIVGDFNYGALANFPKGEGVEIKYDDKTKMTEDIIRILGREFIAVEPVACRAFVNITKPASL